MDKSVEVKRHLLYQITHHFIATLSQEDKYINELGAHIS